MVGFLIDHYNVYLNHFTFYVFYAFHASPYLFVAVCHAHAFVIHIMLAQFLIPPAYRSSAQHFRGTPPAQAEFLLRSGMYGVAVFKETIIVGPGKRSAVRIGNAPLNTPNLKIFKHRDDWFQQVVNSNDDPQILPLGAEIAFGDISITFEPVEKPPVTTSPDPVHVISTTPAKRTQESLQTKSAKRTPERGQVSPSVDEEVAARSEYRDESASVNTPFSSDSDEEAIDTPISARPVPRLRSDLQQSNETSAEPQSEPGQILYTLARSTSNAVPNSTPHLQSRSNHTSKPVPQFAPPINNQRKQQNLQPAADESYARLMEPTAATPQHTLSSSSSSSTVTRNANSRSKTMQLPENTSINQGIITEDQAHNILDVLSEHTVAIKNLQSEIGKLATSINSFNLKLAKTIAVNDTNNQSASAAIAAQIETSNAQQSSALQHLFQASFSKLQTAILQSQQACNSKIDELIILQTNAEE